MQTPPDRTTGHGWIEVIAGSMFSGKSEELIRRLRRAQIARLRVQVFKPEVDTRYSRQEVVSHSDQRIESERITRATEILDRLHADTQVVGIDEAQFLDSDLVEVCERLANNGTRVIVAGLDQDYRGQPFDPVPQLLAKAEYITKTRAICVRCGQPALRSQRTTGRRGAERSVRRHGERAGCRRWRRRSRAGFRRLTRPSLALQPLASATYSMPSWSRR
jgi:thymidine kinase